MTEIRTLFLLILGVFTVLIGLEACTTVPGRSSPERQLGPAQYLDSADDAALRGMVVEIADRRVILAGEIHNRYDHHLSRLAMIKAMHAAGIDFAVGLEAFQRPFQSLLDAYVAGEISEQEMLQGSQYATRWGYDFRLYRPVMEFARAHGIPLVALNAPTELVRQVSKRGIYGLPGQWRNELPGNRLRPDWSYKNRLRGFYARHAGGGKSRFDRFVQVQWLWDEYMAESVAGYLQQHPAKTMVVLAGNGHMESGFGIPERVRHRLGIDPVVVMSGEPGEVAAGAADFVLVAEARFLPRAGRLERVANSNNGANLVRR